MIPLDKNLDHPLLDIIREGERARDSGGSSPYPGGSLEHCLHATGWVSRDLQLALQKATGGNYVARDLPLDPATVTLADLEAASNDAMQQALYGDDIERTTKKSVLEAAIQTVADRGVPYGGVEDNFGRIARMWNQHLVNRGLLETATHGLGPDDVAMMMILMKVARLQALPSHQDSWVDVAGYAACGGEIGAKLAVDV